MMRQFSFLLGVWILVGIFLSGLASATTMAGGGITVEDVGQAPWVFLGEVLSTELITDAQTPSSVFPRWQAQFTRFRVIRGVKGAFHEGEEVELKECGPRSVPSHSLCGILYGSAPASQVGEIFLVITGPGNPNVFGYQTSIRLPASRVPSLSLSPAGHVAPEGPLMEMEVDKGIVLGRWSASGWLIDFSRISASRKANHSPSQGTLPSQGSKSKGSGWVEGEEEKPLFEHGSKSVDLNRLIEQFGGMRP